jgi:exopolyphosphatase/guanosine-5'-triphosphate,3'-diphosphate pyrophosphatase
MRIAAIDIGTNSIHVVIAQALPEGGFEVLDREREVVQVGRGSFATGRLRADAIARTVESLARFVALARGKGAERIVCTATAAVREAANGGDFVRAARAASGITPKVIPAREEGRLIYLAVRSALELGERPSLILDIGGGSLQIVVGDRERIHRVVTAPLGALRLSEVFPLGDPPDLREVGKLIRYIKKTARPVLDDVEAYKPKRAFGSSGSIHALAHVANAFDGNEPIRQINGHVLTRRSLEKATRRLVRTTVEERMRLPAGLDLPRAEILLHGALVLTHLLAQAGVDAITMSDFGVREGLLVDYIGRHAREISRLERVEDLRLRSVLQLLARFRGDEIHARHVAALSLAMFDDLKEEHGLDGSMRRILQYAGLLHDIGSVIGHDRHSAHSHYIITNGSLRGLTAEEVELVAAVARYHGKARPRKSEPEFGALSRASRRAVEWMAALLRIAEALDRSQYQLVRGVRVTRSKGMLTIRALAREDARLEVWAARQRTRLLSRLVDRKVRVVLAAPAAGTLKAPRPGRRAGARSTAQGSSPARRARAPKADARRARSTAQSPRGRAPSPKPAASGAASARAKQGARARRP